MLSPIHTHHFQLVLISCSVISTNSLGEYELANTSWPLEKAAHITTYNLLGSQPLQAAAHWSLQFALEYVHVLAEAWWNRCATLPQEQ